MKSKKLLITFLVLMSLILPITLSSLGYANLHPANGEIEWGVKEGRTYTWVVKQSTEIFGFLPEDSEIEITITSIRALGGGNATELKANITEYNSVTQLTTNLLDNETFINFDSETNIVTLYTFIDDHGFFLPLDYIDGFTDGLMDFYSGFFSTRGCSIGQGITTFYGYRGSTDLAYVWTFNKNGITDNFVAVFNDDNLNDPEDFQYWLVLKSGSDSIPLGNFFLVFIGLAMISLIFICQKKLVKKL